MAEQFTLESPFLNYTFNHIPDNWKAILAAWMAFWALVAIALIYLYAVVFASLVGFETAVLVGIALLILTVGGE